MKMKKTDKQAFWAFKNSNGKIRNLFIKLDLKKTGFEIEYKQSIYLNIK